MTATDDDDFNGHEQDRASCGDEPKHVDKLVGGAIRREREFQGLTDVELSALIGESVDVFRLYEVGKLKVPARELLKISNVLGVPIGSFFTEATHH
jgi:ribosome-binding protein aMBF1 (putative translation factor)